MKECESKLRDCCAWLGVSVCECYKKMRMLRLNPMGLVQASVKLKKKNGRENLSSRLDRIFNRRRGSRSANVLSLIRRENEQKGGNFLSKLDAQIGVASCSSSRTIRHERGDHCGLSKGKLRAIRLGTRRSAVSPGSSSSNRS